MHRAGVCTAYKVCVHICMLDYVLCIRTRRKEFTELGNNSKRTVSYSCGLRECLRRVNCIHLSTGMLLDFPGDSVKMFQSIVFLQVKEE